MFWPAVFGGSVDKGEVRLFSLPVRLGGLGVRDPVDSAGLSFVASREGSVCLVDAIKGRTTFSLADNLDALAASRNFFRSSCFDIDKEVLSSVLDSMENMKARVVRRAVDWKTGGWLTAAPLSSQHFDLSPVEFRDALSMRCKRCLVQIPPVCNGCGGMFSIQHALDCRFGGLVITCHNEIRDSLGDMCRLAYSDARNLLFGMSTSQAGL